MRAPRWWQCGLIGGLTLSLATAVKAARVVLGGGLQGTEWSEIAAFAAAVFGMGFVAGIVAWCGSGLYSRIGTAGDAIAGLAVMVTFFLSCMLLFEPAMLEDKFYEGGLPMLCFAAVIGPPVGIWTGRDLRRDENSRRR